ncbi:RNA polymerase subunit sigma-54 [Aerococcaceae bacterium DSM 111176]|nr:RNA polymerase subunit sigma-54 [Aerococcaceae bacterium DSM 111176]
MHDQDKTIKYSDDHDSINLSSQESDMRVFSGLQNESIQHDEDLLEILDLSVEQLTHYLEEHIMDNPFIELEYSDPEQLSSLEKLRDQDNVVEQIKTPQSLESYLFEQILLYRQTPIRDAMVALVSHLDERGYLPYTTRELAEKLEYPEIIILDAVTLIKQLEPAGVGAYDLRETMMLQTERDNFAPNVAYYLLESYFSELDNEDYTEIMKETNLTQDEIMECVNYYHMLRANPASLFDQTAKINVIPDMTVRFINQESLTMTYNRHYYPRVRFNQDYFDEMLQRKDSALHDYLTEQQEKYQKLADNLRRREELIKLVVKCLVFCQQTFFSNQLNYPKSLSIAALSDHTRLSTPIVYRIITNKNLEFDGHVYALSDFINMSTTKGRTGLTTGAVKQRVLDIDDNMPGLTDAEIVDKLEEEMISISEQIVANYRRRVY